MVRHIEVDDAVPVSSPFVGVNNLEQSEQVVPALEGHLMLDQLEQPETGEKYHIKKKWKKAKNL
jgi:hypothetical protein